MEMGAGTASSENKPTSEKSGGPGSEEVDDSGSILRSKAEGRFDGKHLR